MKLLMIGGTVFLGRHIVEAALAKGHDVTLFNRGQHNADLFPEVEKLRGNRDGDLAALQGRQWDAVVDTSGYVPRLVRASAELLAGSTGHYTFISSLSVYDGFEKPDQDEKAPVATGKLPDETIEEITGETYGPLKVLCEQAAEKAMPGRVLIARPGLIVGPHDPTDRFTYWPVRVAKGGEMLVPGRPDREVQFIDVRDLAEWLVRMIEVGRTGVYNTNGPDYKLSMQTLLEAGQAVSGSQASFTYVSEKFLLDKGVTPWSELPLWVAEDEQPESAGFFKFDCHKAMADGLTFRSPAQTMGDTLEWDKTRPAGLERRAGMKPEREAQLLKAWHESNE